MNKLDPLQQSIVNKDGNVLVTACPGSGKTRVLSFRALREVQDQEQSKRKVAALTYTRRAAEEVKERIRAANTRTNSLWAGTIHAFCLEWILRPYACYTKDLDNGFHLADEFYSSCLLYTSDAADE